MAGTLLSLKADDMLETIVHDRVVVQNTSKKVVAENKNRRWLLIQNDGTDVVYLAFDVPAQLHRGIRLAPGESIEHMLCVSNMCGCQINGICETTTQVLVTEGS